MPQQLTAIPAAAIQPDIDWSSLPLELDDGYVTPMYHVALRGVPPKRTVVYLHGIQSHPAWFSGSCQALARAGAEVFAVTRRGSGENALARGDCRSYLQLIEDVDAAMQFALTQSRRPTAALVGVSWGGKLAALYCLQSQTPVDRLVLVAPGIVPRVAVPLIDRLGIGLCGVAAPKRLFDIPLSEEALFTDNPAMREYLRNDPCRLHRATARFLLHSAVMDAELRRAGQGMLQATTTLLLAQRDRIIHNGRTIYAVNRLTGRRAKVLELPAAHTMDFEPDPAAFFEALTSAVGGLRQA